MDLGRSIDPKGDPKSVENAHCKAFRTASKISDWIVSFATDVGTFTSRTAKSFADAVNRVWEAFFPELVHNVLVDKDNPLKGIYNGEHLNH